jgi:hypothetical protein
MIDKYKELNESLTAIINLIKEFEISRNDYKKPDIRAYQTKISNLGKIIGNKVKEETQKLNDYIDDYLSDPQKNKYLYLIEEAIKLNNDLWEL